MNPAMPAAQQMPARVAAPLRQQIVALISEAISAGTYQAGERLIERDLCARFEVSRTVIREALRHLEALGLVDMVPNRGPVVATVTVEEAAWLYEVRASLEALAGQCCAERATDEDKARLAATVDEVAKYLGTDDMARLLVAKDQFYEALLAGAHNPVIGSLLLTLHARIRLLRSLSLSAPGRAEYTLSELRGIVEAINEGQAQRAFDLCDRHVKNAAGVALTRLAEDAAQSEAQSAATGGA